MGWPGSTQKRLRLWPLLQVVLSAPFLSKLNNEEINFTFHRLIFPSFPCPSKARLNGPWHKNFRNHNPLLFPLFHNPQPCTTNSPPPSCSPRLSNPTHRVSSNRGSLGFSNPWTRLDFLNRVRSPLAPLILSHSSYWLATIESTTLIHLHWLTTKETMPSM